MEREVRGAIPKAARTTVKTSDLCPITIERRLSHCRLLDAVVFKQ